MREKGLLGRLRALVEAFKGRRRERFQLFLLLLQERTEDPRFDVEELDPPRPAKRTLTLGSEGPGV